MSVPASDKLNFSIRFAEPDDIPFIYATWLKSLKYDSELGHSCSKSVFFDNYRLVLDHILGQPDTVVLVACHPDFPSTIYAYLVYEPGILHYCFTKEAFRCLGICTELLHKAFGFNMGAGAPRQCTHKTTTVERYSFCKYFTFNPFLLYTRYQ